MVKTKPKLKLISLWWSLLLKCPTCGKTPLLRHGITIKFRKGCPHCDYNYEREPGYFWGQAMMISYPFIGMGLFLTGVTLKTVFPEIGSYMFAAALTVLAIPVSVILNPHSRVCWMLLDLYLNPLNENDRLAD